MSSESMVDPLHFDVKSTIYKTIIQLIGEFIKILNSGKNYVKPKLKKIWKDNKDGYFSS